jgi:transketolase
MNNEQYSLVANTIRCLCADMIEKAKSGHPGAAMGMADMVTVLYLNHLKIDPKDVSWVERDRLVFSGGHASSLVYALNHLTGTGNVSMDELKEFRQFGSRCAGHPERGVMPGVEVTTGPLGQGLAMAVGLAIAAKMKGRANHTWVFCGDGDIEEGISHECASLAGTLKVSGLTAVYDFNDIQIEGHVTDTCCDDAKKRFQSYGWKVLEIDGHDYGQIDKAFKKAQKITDAPVMIIAKTIIGKGSPNKAGTHACHGAPLGADEVAATKIALGFDPEKSFDVPEEVYALFAARAKKCRRLRNKSVKLNKAEVPAKAFDKQVLLSALPSFDPEKPEATRNANGVVMNALAEVCPNLVGGSADLEGSNKTGLKKYGWIAPGDFSGRNFHWGVRELAMAAMVNGITAYEDFRGFGATFFVFSDYCRPAIRLAAIMELPSIFIFSHDSFYVGEDGPTHEPVEHLSALRTMPNVTGWRPADVNETAYAWVEMLMNDKGPSCIMTTRQNLPVLKGTSAEGVSRGAYVIYSSGAQDENTILFIATGSEVSLAISAAEKLGAEGIAVRVVSMPSMKRFLDQKCSYREEVVPEYMQKRVIVEAGSRFGWDRFRINIKTTKFVTLDHYGASAPYKRLAEEFGFTVENVYNTARALIG